MSKSIFLGLAVLAVLAVAWLFVDSSPYTSTGDTKLSEGFERLRGVDHSRVAKLVLAKGKGRPAELVKKGDGWVIASLYDYPADAEKVDKVLESLKGIRTGVEAGQAEASHSHFEVDKRKGGFITLFDASGTELAKLVVGKTLQSGAIGTSQVFARFGDEAVTYRLESTVRSDANLWGDEVEGKNYLQKKIFELAEGLEVQTVRVKRPDQPDLVVERRLREPPATEDAATDDATKEDEAEAKKPEEYFVVTVGSETHEVDAAKEWTAKGLLNRAKSIAVADAVAPKPDLGEYGLDEQAQLEATVSYRQAADPEAEAQSLVLRIGNAIKGDDGADENYHFILLEGENAARPYLIQKFGFDGWNKKLEDFLPDPPAEEEAASESTSGERGSEEPAPAEPDPAGTGSSE